MQRGRFAAVITLLVFAGTGSGLAADFTTALANSAKLVTDTYTYLHENPELGKQEVKAHAYLRKALEELGFKDFVDSRAAPTAVIAVLDSGKPGPTVALRAEMDGRRLETGMVEPASHSPRSQADGLMHNCGHDVHAAILLGTASVLSANKDKFAGKIVFLFQPAEETAGGADDIVNERILPMLGVRAIYAQHVAPGLPTGQIAIGSGFILAGSSTFHLKIKGKGSHAAVPHEGTDTPLVAARMATELANYPARHLDIANKPVVISVTRLIADGMASNAIPANAEISGTIRSFENIAEASDGKPSLKDRLGQTVARLAAEADIDYEWSITSGAPPTLNDQILFDQTVRPLLAAWQGTVDTHPGRGMFAEDFAYYTQTIPSLYFALGVSKNGAGVAGVHTADFNIHSDALNEGLRLMTTIGVIATTGRMDWP